MIDGWVAPGYVLVAEAFDANFRERDEVGAAFAATLDGHVIVDLWGGVSDLAADRPWRRDTIQLFFSATAGITGLCLLMLVDRGLLELEAPVSAYWPEFAAHGKQDVTIAQVLSHQARLPALEAPVTEQDATDPRRLARRLADQAPEPDPRASAMCPTLTYGWLCGEILLRVDGRTIGRFFAEEVAGPLGLELWIGLPEELEPRVASISYGPHWGEWLDAFPDEELLRRVWFNPPLFPRERLPWNSRAWHATELASANAIGTARSLARMYGCLARGGELDGVRLLSPETLATGTLPRVEGRDVFTHVPLTFGAGFELQTVVQPFGWPVDAFGYTGAGGSVHGVWPQPRVGFSYAMNQLRNEPDGDARARALLDGLYRSVRSAPAAGVAPGTLMPVAEALCYSDA
jgi:CubicO group peptidase (beta-lactamase class C family)